MTTSPWPRPSSEAISATASLDPTVGTTPAPTASMSTPRHTRIQWAIAPRKSSVPMVLGYPKALCSLAAAASARCTDCGTGSTGEPTDKSICPFGVFMAVCRYVASFDQS